MMQNSGLIQSAQPTVASGESASAEEQSMYDAVVNAGMAMLYNKKMTDRIVAMLQQSSDIPTTVAQIVNMIGEAVQLRLKAKPIPEEVLFHAASELVDLVLELAERSGVVVDEQGAEMAFYKTLELWSEANPKAIQEGMNDLRSDFEQLPPEAIRDVEMRFARKTPVAEGIQNTMRA
jgi:hypothetical protein